LTPRLLLSCGEASGDLYAGALTRELRARVPGLVVAGMGGPAFAAAGGERIEDFSELTVTGFTAIPGKLPRLRAAMARLAADAREHRPAALVVIDFFGFNARLARRVKALGIPVVYYVSPQIWAWRRGRLKTIKAIADRVLVIFPFEEAIYRNAGVPVELVGHPLIDLAAGAGSKEALRDRLGLAAERPLVALLPGSRPGELRRILPDLVAAAARIAAQVDGVQFVLARAPNLPDALLRPALDANADVPPIAIVSDETDAVLHAADVALTASGTATVQAALHDTPMVVVYRLSPLEYRIGKPFVSVDMYAMVNLIAGERIVPELIQDAFTPDALAAEAVSMLTDRARAAAIRIGLARVRAALGGPGASGRAADAILKVAGVR
jgi:lipid-A-disaccharide synthase